MSDTAKPPDVYAGRAAAALLVCARLDGFQRQYQQATGDPMPGNALYERSLMDIVDSARAALAME